MLWISKSVVYTDRLQSVTTQVKQTHTGNVRRLLICDFSIREVSNPTQALVEFYPFSWWLTGDWAPLESYQCCRNSPISTKNVHLLSSKMVCMRNMQLDHRWALLESAKEEKCGVRQTCGELKGGRMTDSNLLCFFSLAHSLLPLSVFPLPSIRPCRKGSSSLRHMLPQDTWSR